MDRLMGRSSPLVAFLAGLMIVSCGQENRNEPRGLMTEDQVAAWLQRADEMETEVVARVLERETAEHDESHPEGKALREELEAKYGPPPDHWGDLTRGFRETPRSSLLCHKLSFWAHDLVNHKLPKYREMMSREGTPIGDESWADMVFPALIMYREILQHTDAVLLLADDAAGYETVIGSRLR